MSRKRMVQALKADLKFEQKQGFFMIYLVISFLYILLLAQIPESFRMLILPFVIFSDPSVLGLFFIGGILLLEKQQGILQSIVVTPLSSMEYMISKVCSLTLVALFAGILISAFIAAQEVNYISLMVGIILTSSFFTLMGILIACRARTVNAFFVKMIPVMLFLVLPVFLLIPFWDQSLLNIIPTVACLRMVYGAYHGNPLGEMVFQIGYMGVLNFFLLKYTVNKFEELIVYGGHNGQTDDNKK